MSKFVTALAADGAINEESITSAELQAIYGPLIEKVKLSLLQQEQMLGQIQVSIV